MSKKLILPSDQSKVSKDSLRLKGTNYSPGTQYPGDGMPKSNKPKLTPLMKMQQSPVMRDR